MVCRVLSCKKFSHKIAAVRRPTSRNYQKLIDSKPISGATLPETNSLQLKNGWLEDVGRLYSFLLGFSIFRCELLVLGPRDCPIAGWTAKSLRSCGGGLYLPATNDTGKGAAG